MSTEYDDEKLVSYLDGELPEPDMEDIRSKIPQDRQLASRIKSLSATWELLGDLPEEMPNPDLAQSTIELVALSLAEQRPTWFSQLKKRPWIVLACCCALTLVVGLFAGRFATRFFTSQLLKNLPTIVEYRSLQNVDSPEWLDKLATIEDLIEAGQDGGPQQIGDGLVPAEIRERAAWVRQLDDVGKGRLEDNLQAFLQTPVERQESLKSIATRIMVVPEQREEQLAIIRAYSAILDAAGTRESERIKSQSLEQRFVAVEQRVVRTMSAKYATEMTDGDRRAILNWLDWLQWDDESFESFQSSNDPDQLVFQELLYRDVEESLVTRQHTDELLQNQDLLSTRARRLLARIQDEQHLRSAIGYWVFSVVSPRSEALRTVAGEQLQEQFDKLRPEDRDLIELMPEDRARRELSRQLGVADVPGKPP